MPIYSNFRWPLLSVTDRCFPPLQLFNLHLFYLNKCSILITCACLGFENFSRNLCLLVLNFSGLKKK